jgi:hypothetical protein
MRLSKRVRISHKPLPRLSTQWHSQGPSELYCFNVSAHQFSVLFGHRFQPVPHRFVPCFGLKENDRPRLWHLQECIISDTYGKHVPCARSSAPARSCSATRRAGTPPGRLHGSHGDATERSGDRESIRNPHWSLVRRARASYPRCSTAYPNGSRFVRVPQFAIRNS